MAKNQSAAAGADTEQAAADAAAAAEAQRQADAEAAAAAEAQRQADAEAAAAAQAAAQAQPQGVPVRVLTACAYGEPNDVVMLQPAEIENASAAGLVDPDPASVAYAQSLRA